MVRNSRFIVVGILCGFLVLLSGCAGLYPLDNEPNAGFINVYGADGVVCKVWVYNMEAFPTGTWSGQVRNKRASGQGILILYAKIRNTIKPVVKYSGNMINGYLAGKGRVILGNNQNGNFNKPFLVYEGDFNNGLPNGTGTMWVYKDNGDLGYILKGIFRNAAVVGGYEYTENGKTETRYRKDSLETTFLGGYKK